MFLRPSLVAETLGADRDTDPTEADSDLSLEVGWHVIVSVG